MHFTYLRTHEYAYFLCYRRYVWAWLSGHVLQLEIVIVCMPVVCVCLCVCRTSGVCSSKCICACRWCVPALFYSLALVVKLCIKQHMHVVGVVLPGRAWLCMHVWHVIIECICYESPLSTAYHHHVLLIILSNYVFIIIIIIILCGILLNLKSCHENVIVKSTWISSRNRH